MQAAAKKFEARIEGLQLQIVELEAEANPDERIAELQSQLTEANKQVGLLKSAPAPTSMVDDAEMKRLRTQVSDSEARLLELEAQLVTTTEDFERVKEEAEASTAHVSALEVKLEERNSKASDLTNIFAELQAKKDRLHAIQLHNSQISSLQRVLTQQERIVDLLARSTDLTGEVAHEWTLYAQDLSASLASLKAVATPTEIKRADASTATDDVPMQMDSEKDQEKDTQDVLVQMLKSEVKELEARVLRRNEQIGSLQRQLNNVEMDLARTRTNQMLAEETVVDLDAERSEHLAEIKELQDHISTLQSPAAAQTLEQQTQTPAEDATVKRLQSALAQAEESVASLQEQLSEAVAAKAQLLGHVEELTAQISQLEQQPARDEALVQADIGTDSAKLGQLEAALAAAEARITPLTSELDKLNASNSTLHSEKSELERKIDLITSQVHDLESTLSTQSAETAATATQAEEELTSLRTSLRKAEDRLASTTLQLDSVQLALAEQRESSSSDSDQIESLQAQLSALESGHETLLSSSATDRATITELTTQISTMEAELAASNSKLDQMQADTETKAVVESELAELRSKHAELERVLAERDEAITARNAEYWTLKEELAELQEEAERSLPSPSPALITPEALAELQSRVAAQETALLKLKSDLSAARSTEELLNEQYSAAQRRVKDLETLLSSQSPAEDTEAKEKLQKAEEEIKYLEERVGELEEELGRKAEEIEEADSKILDALKESKKFATRYSKLSAKYEVLQKEKKDEEGKRGVLEEEVKKLRSQQSKRRDGKEHLKPFRTYRGSSAQLAGETVVER
ncbi:hypothetical protein NDA16_002678 [Ustilago loliicola]|nr:hypothetical protein NDA16_002678 [Ustilago loliicola]